MSYDEYEYREAEKLRKQRTEENRKRFSEALRDEYPPTKCAHGVALSSWCPQCDSETLADQTDEEGWEELEI